MVRVERMAARSFSADRTVGAESSRSGTAPMMSISGSRTSRWVLTVYSAPASKSIGRPVIDRVCHGAGSVCDYSVVQLRELGPDLGLVLARDLLSPPLAVRAGLETDHATPAARTMPMGLTQGRGTPPSDRNRCCLRHSRACPPWPAAYRLADLSSSGTRATGQVHTRRCTRRQTAGQQ